MSEVQSKTSRRIVSNVYFLLFCERFNCSSTADLALHLTHVPTDVPTDTYVNGHVFT